MSPVPDLVTVGESFDDFVFYDLTRLPGAGQEIRTTSFARSPGGGALITAVAAARLGLRCAIVSALSVDCERLMRKERIAIHNLRMHGEPSALSVALSTRADRRFITFEGTNPRLPSRLREVLGRIRARHVHLAFVPRTCGPWIADVERLRGRGITTSWDFGWDDGLARDPNLRRLAGAVDLVFMNADEACLYARRSRLPAALAYWRTCSNHVVVKLGASGARALGGGIDMRAPGARARRVVDSTGAGDAFNGGFLAALIRGRSLRLALAAGNRVGARSLGRAGGIAGLPRAGSRP
jgi:sugar/nucleoside kinase (ribokinase family)